MPVPDDFCLELSDLRRNGLKNRQSEEGRRMHYLLEPEPEIVISFLIELLWTPLSWVRILGLIWCTQFLTSPGSVLRIGLISIQSVAVPSCRLPLSLSLPKPVMRNSLPR